MAIKYISIPEKKATIAVLHETEWAAVDNIKSVLDGTKSLWFDPTKYRMKSSYKATVICRDGDEYSEERGREEAKKKLMRNYYRSLDKKIDEFIEDINTAMYRVVARCPERKENEKSA